MKLIIDYSATLSNRKRHILGYWFEAENKEEEENLSIIRNQIIFGLKDNNTCPIYAGRINDEETQLVKAIGYEIPANVRTYLIGNSVAASELSKYTKTNILNK